MSAISIADEMVTLKPHFEGPFSLKEVRLALLRSPEQNLKRAFERYPVDPAHQKINLHTPGLCWNIWYDKYRWVGAPEGLEENHPHDTYIRVAWGVFYKELSDAMKASGVAPMAPIPKELEGVSMPEIAKVMKRIEDTFYAMVAGLWIPGGRITAGAGTSKRVTLFNCYVNGELEDDLGSITREWSNMMFTSQQGGGVGTDFSPLRPRNAVLRRTGGRASGPMPFMDSWDAGGETIKSAGDRHAAFMGTLSCTHPDLPEFIGYKQTKGKLENFNQSILATDAFMGAIDENEDWQLFFDIPPVDERSPLIEALDFVDDKGVKQYVYSNHVARELWNTITEHTYEYSEPGVIYIDRVNEMNNLVMHERISCTNPCGEQPLPPHGCCDLGHLNLARMVKSPFTNNAAFDYDLMRSIAEIAVRFLDNVIDVTRFPLPQQEAEQVSKRRIGCGYLGLASAIAQLGIRYGTFKSQKFSEDVGRELCISLYESSIAIASEKGPFPLWNQPGTQPGYEGVMFGEAGFISQRLPRHLQERILSEGIRNSLLMSLAPTGTGATYNGNTESGMEPTFLYEQARDVIQADGSKIRYVERTYTANLWRSLHGDTPYPKHFVQAGELTVVEHVQMLAAVQKWVDAAVSKTINCPEDMPYDEFVQVYNLAYSLGCKGCTTYRPSKVRGSVLSDPNAKKEEPTFKRPEILRGSTQKFNWPTMSSAIYIIINPIETKDGLKPYEVLMTSKDQRDMEWITAVTVLMSYALRQGLDPFQIASEFQQIHSTTSGAFMEGKYHPSLVSYLGYKLRKQFIDLGFADPSAQDLIAEVAPISPNNLTPTVGTAQLNRPTGPSCLSCGSFDIRYEENCAKCNSCGHSKCS